MPSSRPACPDAAVPLPCPDADVVRPCHAPTLTSCAPLPCPDADDVHPCLAEMPSRPYPTPMTPPCAPASTSTPTPPRPCPALTLRHAPALPSTPPHHCPPDRPLLPPPSHPSPLSFLHVCDDGEVGSVQSFRELHVFSHVHKVFDEMLGLARELCFM
nr:vegetative cell wall protein gp1-like [Aegilops tauschii subsp. strangulata]